MTFNNNKYSTNPCIEIMNKFHGRYMRISVKTFYCTSL